MTEPTTTKVIMKSMESLFRKAEQHRLWFYCSYQSLWFSPEGLREQQANGRFLWGAANWELRDPRERVTELRNEGKQAFKQAESLEAEIGRKLAEGR